MLCYIWLSVLYNDLSINRVALFLFIYILPVSFSTEKYFSSNSGHRQFRVLRHLQLQPDHVDNRNSQSRKRPGTWGNPRSGDKQLQKWCVSDGDGDDGGDGDDDDDDGYDCGGGCDGDDGDDDDGIGVGNSDYGDSNSVVIVVAMG